MTFEEDFPSLDAKELWYECENGAFDYFDHSTIKKYCLDKQKVKDAINKIIGHDTYHEDCDACKLLKELNLE